MDFWSDDRARWKAELEAYDRRLESLGKADLASLDSFYRKELPLLLHQRDPDPFLSKPELVRLMKWKLSRGKWRYITSQASAFFPIFIYYFGYLR
jgi:hypothetical protein